MKYLTFKRSYQQPCYRLKKKSSVVYLCRPTVLQHQPFQHMRHFSPIQSLLHMFAIIHIAASYLPPLNAPSVYQEACRACLIGFSEVPDVCARHCNPLKRGHWYDVVQTERVIHRSQCKFFTLCLEFRWVVWVIYESKWNIYNFPSYWADKNSGYGLVW